MSYPFDSSKSDQKSNPLPSGSDQLAEQLAGDLLCPLCGIAYTADGIRMVRHTGNRWTLSVQCFCCGTGSLLTAHAHISPDLTPGELVIFAQMAPLSEDDVLDMHHALQHELSTRQLLRH